MHICNSGTSGEVRDYTVETLRGRSSEELNKRVGQRRGRVIGHLAAREHVWNLVAKALAGVGYGKKAEQENGHG